MASSPSALAAEAPPLAFGGLGEEPVPVGFDASWSGQALGSLSSQLERRRVVAEGARAGRRRGCLLADAKNGLSSLTMVAEVTLMDPEFSEGMWGHV